MVSFDYSVFYISTCKFVSESFARLFYNGFLANTGSLELPGGVKTLSYEASLTDKNLEKALVTAAKTMASTRFDPFLIGPTNTGNMYTASLYSSLISLVNYVYAEELENKRASLFSYDFGIVSSFFSAQIKS